jgi:hypothetical protein
MWFLYNPPADSLLVHSTITTHDLPCPGQELRLGASQEGSGFICSLSVPPPHWLCVEEGRDST